MFSEYRELSLLFYSFVLAIAQSPYRARNPKSAFLKSERMPFSTPQGKWPQKSTKMSKKPVFGHFDSPKRVFFFLFSVPGLCTGTGRLQSYTPCWAARHGRGTEQMKTGQVNSDHFKLSGHICGTFRVSFRGESFNTGPILYTPTPTPENALLGVGGE